VLRIPDQARDCARRRRGLRIPEPTAFVWGEVLKMKGPDEPAH